MPSVIRILESSLTLKYCLENQKLENYDKTNFNKRLRDADNKHNGRKAEDVRKQCLRGHRKLVSKICITGVDG